MQILKELCESFGVSGCEKQVGSIIINQIAPYADSVEIDILGNIIAFKKGYGSSDKKVAVMAHMDEVGLIVSDITEDGYVKFEIVGGVDSKVLCGSSVFIGNKMVRGVIGLKAVHLQKKSEKEEIDDLVVDIGADSKAEAEGVISVGDYISFDSEFVEFGEGYIKAKALDDRVGCRVLMEAVKGKYFTDTYFCWSVCEELGLRGAHVLSEKIKPDYAVILEATTANDLFDVAKENYSTELTKGVAITIIDGASYGDRSMIEGFVGIAKKEKIRYQFKNTITGGNDAGAMIGGGFGTKCISLSVPCRYLHSPVSVIFKDDFYMAQSLLISGLKWIGKE